MRTDTNSDSDSTPSYTLVCSKVTADYDPDKSIKGDHARYTI